MFPKTIIKLAPWLLAITLLASACSNEQTPAPTDTLPAPSATPIVRPTAPPTPTPFQPSPTPLPLAARVNGEEITLAEFQAELARFEAARQAAGSELAAGYEQQVLDDLINQILLVQGAREAGFVVDEATLQARLDELVVSAGEAAFLNWLASNGYILETFRPALARSIAAAWMRDHIVNSVPQTADQVHARQILLYNSEQSNEVFAQLQTGKDFATLAVTYDPTAAGDLDWFPRGYLTDLQLEEAAFSLQPGEYSAVIQTRLGYHILQVIERDPQRPLTPDARFALQNQALHNWLETRRSQSEIVILYELP